jgi:hypothetical protein
LAPGKQRLKLKDRIKIKHMKTGFVKRISFRWHMMVYIIAKEMPLVQGVQFNVEPPPPQQHARSSSEQTIGK